MGASTAGTSTGQMADFMQKHPDALQPKTTQAPSQPTFSAPVSYGQPLQYESYGKGSPSGKGGSNVTFPGQSGQPKMGVPNTYANTIQSGDNSGVQQPGSQMKGKGS